VLVIFRYSPY